MNIEYLDKQEQQRVSEIIGICNMSKAIIAHDFPITKRKCGIF